MIEWGNFLLVLVSSIVAACGVVVLFSLGLRFAGPETHGRRRAIGVVCFVLCGLAIAYGVYLIIPALHQS
jgi:succinate dehydrogenase hydrophobic anchor subunit